MKTVATQLQINNIDWPKSGCSIKRIITELNNIKLKKYLIWEFLNLSNVKIFTVIKIKKGFNISIGCSLKKYKSIHRLAPFTSTPIAGTKAKNIKVITNNDETNFRNISVLIAEIITMTNMAKKVKIRCLVKKK